jgi:DNA repair protein RecO (recombination protein O)
MDETYTTKAIVLNRQAYREQDSRITFYTFDRGKIDLVARGTKKLKSKLAGHLEPICLVNLMVIKGRQFDYVGTSLSENSFINIKEDLEKTMAAGQAVAAVNKLIKENVPDEEIFELLLDLFQILNDKKTISDYADMLYNSFILKLLALLGYAPQLYQCVSCNSKILANDKLKFDIVKGGILCGKCQQPFDKNALTISDNCLKILRLYINENLSKILSLKIEKDLQTESNNIINNFLQIFIK